MTTLGITPLFLFSASYELAHVTYVKSPEHFYVQRCADKERLQIMMQSLNKYCRNTDKQEDLVFFVEKGIYYFMLIYC